MADLDERVGAPREWNLCASGAGGVVECDDGAVEQDVDDAAVGHDVARTRDGFEAPFWGVCVDVDGEEVAARFGEE